jgi:hypothetical protein
MTNDPWLDDFAGDGGVILQIPPPSEREALDIGVAIDESRRFVGDRSIAALSFGRAFEVDVVFPADVVRGADPFRGIEGGFADLLPHRDKSEWVLQHLGSENKLAMADDLFRVAVDVCRSRDLRPLENAVLSWEATAEELADANGASIRDEGESDTPIPLDELKRRLSS